MPDKTGDWSRMFARRATSSRAATLVVEEGQLRRAPAGRRLHVRPDYDAAIERDLRTFFDRFGTVSFDNYPIGALRDAPARLG